MKHSAILALALVAAAAAADAPPEAASVPVVPFTELRAGDAVGCSDAGGCVAMTKDVLRALVKEAIQRGRASCGKEV